MSWLPLPFPRCGEQKDIDTHPFREAIWYYIHSIKGIRHDDYLYRKVSAHLHHHWVGTISVASLASEVHVAELLVKSGLVCTAKTRQVFIHPCSTFESQTFCDTVPLIEMHIGTVQLSDCQNSKFSASHANRGAEIIKAELILGYVFCTTVILLLPLLHPSPPVIWVLLLSHPSPPVIWVLLLSHPSPPVQVNQVLEIPFKSYIRMLACFPEKITFYDFTNSMSGLQHSEKVSKNPGQ